jgi:hypothetical protein
MARHLKIEATRKLLIEIRSQWSTIQFLASHFSQKAIHF